MMNHSFSYSLPMILNPNLILKSSLKKMGVLYILFFLSGVAALIYQLMWQRMLFTILGVDLQSITIVVSVFMFGLGIGGIIGGVMADKYQPLLGIYVLIEWGIGIFGMVSPTLLQWVGNLTFNEHYWFTFLCSFIALSIPTLLMGSTFPILVAYVNRLKNNIGESVGSLYFSNTLGAAMGAFLSGFILLNLMNLNQAVYLGALINFAIGSLGYIALRVNRL